MMTAHTDNPHPLKYAGTAGLLYLVIIVCGLFSELFVRSALIIWKDAETTAGNILASQGLFRVGLVADSVMLFADIAIAVILYLMFRPVNRPLSLTAAAFRLTEAAILGFNLLIYYTTPLALMRRSPSSSADSPLARRVKRSADSPMCMAAPTRPSPCSVSGQCQALWLTLEKAELGLPFQFADMSTEGGLGRTKRPRSRRTLPCSATARKVLINSQGRLFIYEYHPVNNRHSLSLSV
jgi:hypothetical protein